MFLGLVRVAGFKMSTIYLMILYHGNNDVDNEDDEGACTLVSLVGREP